MGIQEQGQEVPPCDFPELGPTTPGATPGCLSGSPPLVWQDLLPLLNPGPGCPQGGEERPFIP